MRNTYDTKLGKNIVVYTYACPNCRGPVWTTDMAYHGIDRNAAKCTKCDWVGIAEETKIEEIRCPKCKSPRIESTCMGCMPGRIDNNWSLCHDCGWHGIREECKVPHKVED